MTNPSISSSLFFSIRFIKVSLSWIGFSLVTSLLVANIELGSESGNCVRIVGSLIDLLRYLIALQISAVTMIKFLSTI